MSYRQHPALFEARTGSVIGMLPRIERATLSVEKVRASGIQVEGGGRLGGDPNS